MAAAVCLLAAVVGLRPAPSPAAPAEDAADQGVAVETSGALSTSWAERLYQPEDIWAWKSIHDPAVPWGALGEEGGHPIDAFIRRRLNEKDLKPAPAADRRTLIRRAHYDLTGLPPAPQRVETFVRDDSPDAFVKVIDRLLASPQYGEQWARHWLDVARYADTAGFANDFERPNAWRYRDYVIRAFNEDKPFDRFITEQIAGDELKNPTPETLIATGFLRMGPWEHTGMSVEAVTRKLYLDDATTSVGRVFLAQNLRCVRCHDHKFDPITTRDYYRMKAIFAPVQLAERKAAFLEHENARSFERGQRRVEQRIEDSRRVIERINKKHRRAVDELLEQRGVERAADLPAGERPKRHYGLSAKEMSLEKMHRKRIQFLRRSLNRYEPLALSVYNGPPRTYNSNRPNHPLPPAKKRTGEPQAIHILKGGSLEAPGEKVTPGVLSAMYGTPGVEPPEGWEALTSISRSTEGRRLALARWITSEHNTLTARVIVNRVWQHHFAGKGIVATPNDFGAMGAEPTHPELLDWLATWFMEHGWSIKELHRLIMTSEAYQRAGAARHPSIERVRRVDAGNDLLAYYPPRRLAAEEVRDSMLAVTGELSNVMGGPGVHPKINWEAALRPRHVMGTVAPAYQPSPKPTQRHRRTIYAFRYRTLVHPMLQAFDRPGANNSCPRRAQTTVTPQVFALFNSEWTHDRALALARRVEREAETPAQRIERAFRLTYQREPTEAQRNACVQHYGHMLKHHRHHEPVKTEPPTVVTREMFEELTGETVRWKERLDRMDEYQPDLKPWQVSPETRALAEVCLVLLNSNEFLYVY